MRSETYMMSRRSSRQDNATSAPDRKSRGRPGGTAGDGRGRRGRRDARGRRRRADERASDRVKARRRLLEETTRTSNAEIEFGNGPSSRRTAPIRTILGKKARRGQALWDVYGELKFWNGQWIRRHNKTARDHDDQRKQLSDRRRGGTREKRMRCIEKVRTADRDVSDAALEAG